MTTRVLFYHSPTQYHTQFSRFLSLSSHAIVWFVQFVSMLDLTGSNLAHAVPVCPRKPLTLIVVGVGKKVGLTVITAARPLLFVIASRKQKSQACSVDHYYNVRVRQMQIRRAGLNSFSISHLHISILSILIFTSSSRLEALGLCSSYFISLLPKLLSTRSS